jgi:hypothetical protein
MSFYENKGLKCNIILIVLKRENILDTCINMDWNIVGP